MAVLSKLCGPSFSHNCCEIAHIWTPSCSNAAIDVGVSLFTECAKMYSVMYLVLQIVQRKFSPKDFLNTALNTFASTSFLAFNGFSFVCMFCLLRKCLGIFYFNMFAFVPGVLSSFLAIFLERKYRRGPLAVYVANIASEILFRMAVARGLIKPIPNGEIFLFCAAISSYCYIIRKHKFPGDNVGAALKYILGDEEATCTNKSANQLNVINDEELSSTHTDPKKMAEDSETTNPLLRSFQRWTQAKHFSCPHRLSCAQYSAQGFLRSFTIACISSLGIQCSSMFWKLLFKPLQALRYLNYKRSLKMGLFFGGFVWTFRTVNCVLRWLFKKDAAEYALPAAFIGGLFMKFFPNASLALYLAWKAIELLYDLGLENGMLPEIRGFMAFLYAISAGIIFHALLTEPQSMRRSYTEFLIRLTKSKFDKVNRCLSEEAGVPASKMDHSILPSLAVNFKRQSSSLN